MITHDHLHAKGVLIVIVILFFFLWWVFDPQSLDEVMSKLKELVINIIVLILLSAIVLALAKWAFYGKKKTH